MDNSQVELEKIRQELAEIKEKLQIAEQTLQAIQSGEVDALVVSNETGVRVFTLQRADYTYQLLVEQMGEGAATIDDNGLILYCNQRLSEKLNCPPENLMGSNFINFVAPQDQKVFLSILEQISSEQIITTELSLISLTERQEISVQLSLRRYKIDEIIINNVVITDITQRTIREATKLNQILNATNAVVISYRIFTDGGWIFDYWSEGCEHLFGYTVKELIADQSLWINQVIPEDRPKITPQIFTDFPQGKTHYIEYRFQHRDGSLRWIGSSRIVQWDQVNNCWLGMAISTEITQRKQVELALEEAQNKIKKQEEQFRLALELTETGVWDWELQENTVIWNSYHYSLLGYKVGEVVISYQAWLDRIHPDDRTKTEAKIRQSIDDRSIYEAEYRVIYPDGTTHWLLGKGQAIYDELGQPLRMTGITIDITDKKQLEKQFYHAQRLESLGTLAGGIAHDFNNILTPILGISQLLNLRFPNLDEKIQHLLTLVSDSAMRGADLVKQILLFSRKTEGDWTTLQLGYLLLEIIEIIKPIFPKSISIESEISPRELWTISADATQMHQVFMNLVVNARDAMPEGGILTIKAENYELDEYEAQRNLSAKAGAYVIVTVSDTGTGIAPELLERIFDPFFTTKETGKGTGLGLATVMGILKNHNGFIKVYSKLGRGTEFKVFLPTLKEDINLISTEEIILKGNGELILIVDDETTIQEVTKNILENFNYRTILANDGLEAVTIYREQPSEIKVIILDMMMPNLDGVKAIRRLQEINPQVNIIATSGLMANEKIALSANVKTFLGKPYTNQQLLKAITEIITNQSETIKPIPTEKTISNPDILKEVLSQMPSDWLEQMYQGAYAVDADLMLELLEQIPDDKALLADTLKKLINDFEIDLIMKLIAENIGVVS